MPFLFGLGEKIAIGLAADLVKASASKVRRLLSKEEAQKALESAIAAALDDALTAVDLPEAEQAHYEHVFQEFFRCEAVIDELAPLLDPRPDVELDLEALSRELREAGCDPESIQSFHLDDFLRQFASAFYAAAASQPALRDNLEMKLLGEMVSRMGVVAQASERSAVAMEKVGGLLERYLKNQEEGTVLLAAGQQARGQGFLPALDFYEQIAAAMWRAGFDFGVGRQDVIEIGGSASLAAKALPPAQAETLRKLAGDLRRTVLDHEPTAADLAALEERYRQHLIHWFGSLQFQGLMRTPRPIVLPLEEVYVELRAVAEVPEAADAFSIEERRLFLDVDEKDAAGRRELMSQLDALRRERWSRTLPERKSMAEALHQRDRRAFVILGDPGSGKTTLLHFLALVYARGPETAAARLKLDPTEADRLPIFVPLAAFDDMLREVPGLTLAEFLARYYDRRRSLPGLGPLFRRALESGRALVLLDGLDEVLDTGTRSYVAAQAGALIGEWSPRGVRFAVSSRFVGYREAPVPGGLPTLSVLDFGTPEIEVFVHRWARAYETWAANGESPEALRRARTLESDLLIDAELQVVVATIHALSSQVAVAAKVRQAVMEKLGSEIWEIRQAVVGVLASLVESDRTVRATVFDRLDDQEVFVQMEAMTALAALGADEEVREAILAKMNDSNWIIRWAAVGATAGLIGTDQDIRRAVLAKVDDPDNAVREAAVSALQRVCGTDQDVHRALLTKLNDPGPNVWEAAVRALSGVAKTVNEVRRTILAKMESGSEQDRVAALRSLTSFLPSDLEVFSVLQNQLRAVGWQARKIVAEILGENVGAIESVEHLLNLSGNCDALESLALLELGEAAPGQLLGNERWRLYWLDKTTSKDAEARAAAVAALKGRIEIDGEVRRVILERLGDEFPYVRESALYALSEIVGTDAEVRAVVLAYVRGSALDALSGAVGTDAKVRVAALKRLEDEVPYVRRSALGALSGVVGTDARVRAAALERLGDKNPSVQGSAFDALSGLVGTDTEVRAAVLARLGDEDASVRGSALGALSSVVGTGTEVRAAALARLVDEDPSVRQLALYALSGIVGTDSEVRAAVLARLGDEDPYARGSAMGALSRVVGTDAEVQAAVLEKMEDESYQARQAAVAALARLFGEVPAVTHAIVDRLGDRDFPVRLAAVKAISDSSRVLEDTLLTQLRPWLSLDAQSSHYPTTSHDVRRVQAKLADLFGSRVPKDPTLRDGLFSTLRDPRWSARFGAVLALLAWPDGPPDDVLDRIFEALDDRRGLEAYPAQLAAASFLINQNDHAQASIDLCLEALDYGTRPWEEIGPSSDVRQQAALVLGKLDPLFFDERVYGKLLQVMESDQSLEVIDAAYGTLVRLARAWDRTRLAAA